MRFILTCLILGIATPLAAQLAEPASRITADVAYLASELLEGRAFGSAGGDSASLFIARRYGGLEVQGAFVAQCPSPTPCGAAYFQVFEFEEVRGENVVAFIPGAHDELSRRYVLIGAHYDHLGRAGRASLDPRRGTAIRPGADDNASGTAAMLELVRRFARDPAPMSVLFAHFDGEELGLIGSRVFVDNSPVPLDAIALMINLDMVGRLGEEPLMVEVTPPAEPYEEGVDELARTLDLPLQSTTDIVGRSDHSSFSDRDVPSIALHTGFHGDYHRVTDTVDKVDITGILRVIDLVEAIVRSAATLPDANR